MVIICGRDRATLANWLGDLPLDFIAEHGMWLRAAGEDWQLFQPLRADWKRDLRPVLELYVVRTAGSFMEEKDFSLVWHYRRADTDLGIERARELLSHLSLLTANTDLQVLEGNKVLEIKNAGINKGAAAARWVERYPSDFILALGDDRTAEDTFRALPPAAYTVRVGTGARSLSPGLAWRCAPAAAQIAEAGYFHQTHVAVGLREIAPLRAGFSAGRAGWRRAGTSWYILFGQLGLCAR